MRCSGTRSLNGIVMSNVWFVDIKLNLKNSIMVIIISKLNDKIKMKRKSSEGFVSEFILYSYGVEHTLKMQGQ